MELVEDAADRSALRKARHEQKLSAVEFREDGPLTEFQEFELNLENQLRPVDKYALRFFGCDRSPIPSIEIVEKRKKSVEIRRTLYELQCGQQSERYEASEKFLDDLLSGRGRWALAT